MGRNGRREKQFRIDETFAAYYAIYIYNHDKYGEYADHIISYLRNPYINPRILQDFNIFIYIYRGNVRDALAVFHLFTGYYLARRSFFL